METELTIYDLSMFYLWYLYESSLIYHDLSICYLWSINDIRYQYSWVDRCTQRSLVLYKSSMSMMAALHFAVMMDLYGFILYGSLGVHCTVLSIVVLTYAHTVKKTPWRHLNRHWCCIHSLLKSIHFKCHMFTLHSCLRPCSYSASCSCHLKMNWFQCRMNSTAVSILINTIEPFFLYSAATIL